MALTILATAGSPRKSWNGTTGTLGTVCRARSASPAWVNTRSASLGISATAECSTFTPAFASCFFSELASMTLDPMPASHATISFLMLDPSTVAISVSPSLEFRPSGCRGCGLRRALILRALLLGRFEIDRCIHGGLLATEAEQQCTEDERHARGQQNADDDQHE